MMSVTSAKVALAAIGMLVWAYGHRVDDAAVRWAGIAFLVAAVLLRFVARRRPPRA